MADILDKIENVANQASRLNKLSKSKEGRYLLGNFALSELESFEKNYLKKGDIEDNSKLSKEFLASFNDLIRPNYFKVEIIQEDRDGYRTQDFTSFTRNIDIPFPKANTFKLSRIGQDIVIPLNNKIENGVKTTFLLDTNNQVMNFLLLSMQSQQYGYSKWKRNADTLGEFTFKISYPIKIHTNKNNITKENTEGLKFAKKFLNKAGNFLMSKAREQIPEVKFVSPIINALFNNEQYINTGDGEIIDKFFSNRIYNFTYEILLKNIFLTDFSNLNFDMEKTNSYSTTSGTIHYKDIEYQLYLSPLEDGVDDYYSFVEDIIPYNDNNS